MDPKELALELAAEAIKTAHEVGLTRVILGASPEAMHAMAGGKKLGTPLPVLRLEIIYDDATSLEVKVPVFCDPGLMGTMTVYAIQWPAAPVVQITIED